jgi:hypothetical protein
LLFYFLFCSFIFIQPSFQPFSFYYRKWSTRGDNKFAKQLSQIEKRENDSLSLSLSVYWCFRLYHLQAFLSIEIFSYLFLCHSFFRSCFSISLSFRPLTLTFLSRLFLSTSFSLNKYKHFFLHFVLLIFAFTIVQLPSLFRKSNF